MVHKRIFERNDIGAEAFLEVRRIGNDLFEYLSSPEVVGQLNEANSPGNSSARVQNVFLKKAEQLGFQAEKKRLFDNIQTKKLRPDYY